MTAETMQTSYITTRKTYLLTCSACGECREVQASQLPHSTAPYTYHCPCGEKSEVRLVSFRRAPRKAVALNGVLAVSTPNGTRHLLIRVEDLSASGVRVGTDRISEIQPPMEILLGLPGAVRRTLKVSCQLKRHHLQDHRLELALEFQGLSPEQEEALAAFLTERA
jgi:PilZ domain